MGGQPLDFWGQRPGLFDLPPLWATVLTGDEFGADVTHQQLMLAASQALRAIQSGPGLPNDETGWLLAVNKNGRKKMGDNARQTDGELRAIAGISGLVKKAVVGERHRDEQHQNEYVIAVCRMYAPLVMGGLLYRVKLTVKEYVSGASPEPHVLHALSAFDIENAPLGTFPASTVETVLQPDQPTTGRVVSVRELLYGAQRQDGTAFCC
ncbi:MAG: hypothetical protein AB3X37_03325 [Leptothrix ochracea]|uniref:LPD3 domain-containing protein n=1 Tax=Leptothrix ochracea TaxID=735331 RepID=UPI0034E1BD7F